MGANSHPTTRVETDSLDVRRERLKSDLAMCESIVGVRDSMVSENGLIVQATNTGLGPKALGVLSEHDARVGQNKNPDDPFEVFLE